MLENNKDITIIIPSSCRLERSKHVRDALQSLFDQKGGCPKIIFAANGPNVDNAMYNEIASFDNVTAFYTPTPSAPLAVLEAVKSHVDTMYFGFLDDDDFYYREALIQRKKFLISNPDFDVAIGRAEVEDPESGHRHFLANLEDMSLCRQDPFAVIYKHGINWMTSAAGLFRASKIDVSFFENSTPYFEWTYLASKLIVNGIRFGFIDSGDHLINQLPEGGSLSKTESYKENEETFLRRVLDLPLTPKERGMVKGQLCDFYHHQSDLFRENGRFSDAFCSHLKSLSTFRGLKRYAFGTRKFIF